MALNDAQIRTLASDWYAALDRHAPLPEVTGFLAGDDFEMNLPEGVLHGVAGFAGWYEIVTNRFFDERQTITRMETEVCDGAASVDIEVNWQARMWNPPAARSDWIGFEVNQSWQVVAAPDGDGARIRAYTINALTPMPGSAAL